MTDITFVNFTPGSGGKLAVDTVAETGGDVSVPISKIMTGNAGVNGGLVSDDNPLPVNMSGLLNTYSYGGIGQKPSLDSAPVVIASDQTAIPVTADAQTPVPQKIMMLAEDITTYVEVGPGSRPMPVIISDYGTSHVTASIDNQVTVQAILDPVTVTGLPAVGQGIMDTSVPVVIAANQSTIPVSIASDNPAIPVSISPPNTYGVKSNGTNSETIIKYSAGYVTAILASNTNAAAQYLKLYDLGAYPTVGTDVPVITFAIPPAGHISIPVQVAFGNGIAMALTTGMDDTDTGVVLFGEVKVLISWL